MDPNEEFMKKLACLECSRQVKAKPKWYRLHQQANAYHFYYRCVKCYSEYRTAVTPEDVARLEALGIVREDAAAPSKSKSTSVPEVDVNTSWTYFTFPKFHRKWRERRQMKKYRRAFKKQLRAKENDCLSSIAAREGQARKRQSD